MDQDGVNTFPIFVLHFIVRQIIFKINFKCSKRTFKYFCYLKVIQKLRWFEVNTKLVIYGESKIKSI